MEYLELCIHDIPEEQQDILTFVLSESGFESFASEGNELMNFFSQ